MVLPLLGGSPAVWNTCLMFFQAALLGGYLYAHLSTRLLGSRRQALVHAVLLALAGLALPVAIPAGWTPPASDGVVGWLLALLVVAVGAPFLLLSATAPLLQRWLSTIDHPAAANPYALYAASNAGSFVGLLAYPTVLEPTLRLGQQSRLWNIGYVLAVGLTWVCAVYVRRHARKDVRPPPADLDATAGAAVGAPPRRSAPGAVDRLRWVALAFVPSSLLLGVTTYLTTDVAAVPLLWVAPLALYLLTFVIVFARSGHAAPRLPAELHALMVTVFALLIFWQKSLPDRWAFPLHLGLFALTALVLHGELAASRPGPRYLTEFYLWLALGGALGGVFNALAAPMLFDSVQEYVPMVLLACFLRPSRPLRTSAALARVRLIATAAIPALLLAFVASRAFGVRHVMGVSGALIASVPAAMIALSLRDRGPLFGAALAGVVFAGPRIFLKSDALLDARRSFFGSYRVVQSHGTNFFYHGTTIHGAQFPDPERRLQPVTYFHPDGPAGHVFRALEPRLEGRKIGVVGLGVGSLLCYARPGQEWTFFEIDPLVERIARNPAYFTFLRDCPVRPRVVLGDARLTLASERPGTYALLVLDAFSSDAVPVHLLTREALGLYERLLEPGGALLVNISNQHLRLEPVVAALATDLGVVGLISEHTPGAAAQVLGLDYSCDWAILVKRKEDAGELGADPDWRAVRTFRSRQPWTDDYSDLFSLIRW
jgi:hypothetical protein